MQTGFISFCGKQSLNIKSNDTKKLFNDKLLDYGVQILHKHFQKYNDFTFDKIKSNPHILSLKSNGNPYFMFLTKFNDTDICLMIDKKIQQGYFLPRMIIDRLSFDESLFQGTLIEGEMINTGDEWIFIMNDVIVHLGKKLDSTNVLKRLNILYDIVDNKYFPLPNQKFSIQVKKYFKLHDIDKMIAFKENLVYSTRGIIFKPMFLKFKDILHNFDDSLIDNTKKVKYSETNKFIENIEKKVEKKTDSFEINNKKIIAHAQHVINSSVNNNSNMVFSNQVFSIEKTDKPDVYILYDDSNNRNIGMACIPTLKTSKFMRKVFKDASLNEKIKFECEYNEKFSNKWVPIKQIVQNL